jgi:hypothetical protein
VPEKGRKKYTMSAAIPPFRPGEKGLAANTTTYAKLLGNTYTINGVVWKVIQVSAALTTCSSQALVDAGTTSFTNIAATVTAGATARFLGILPTLQQDLAINDYALAAVQGQVTALAGATVTAGNGLTSAALGRLTDVAGAFAATTPAQNIGLALSTAAAGSPIQILLLRA